MIFWFSGTGNSKYAAQELARLTNDKLVSISECVNKGIFSFQCERNESIGIVFPVYGWTLPKVVKEFVTNLTIEGTDDCTYIYALMTCGDDIGKCRNVLSNQLENHKLHLSAAFSLQMPNTYVCLPLFNVDSPKVEANKLSKAALRINNIVQFIEKREKITDIVEGGMARIKTYIIAPLFLRLLVHDRWFRINSNCISCKRCELSCPINNIEFKNNSPHWKGLCTGCLACYHSCPQNSIQFGKLTKNKGQYLKRS